MPYLRMAQQLILSSSILGQQKEEREYKTQPTSFPSSLPSLLPFFHVKVIFLKKFQVHRKIERKVQRFPIYSLHIHA